MKKIIHLLLTLALAILMGCASTVRQAEPSTTVAVLPSDGAALNSDELEALTDEMREAALKVLPTNTFVLLKQDVVVRRLGGAENYINECIAGSCIVDLGKKAQVDYVAKASVLELGNRIRLKVELHNVRTEGQVGMLNDDAENVEDLFAIVKKRVPDEVFGKIPGASEYTQAKEAARFTEDYKALEAERREQAKEQARIEALEEERRKQAEKQARKEALEAEKLEKARIKELEVERRRQANMNNSWETEQKLRRAERQITIGYQNLYKMPLGVRWSLGWFYNTLSFRSPDFKEWSLDGYSNDIDDYNGAHFYLANPDRIFKDGVDEYRHSGGYTDDAFEWIVGYIWRPFYWLGVFGGGGFRHTDEFRRYDIYYVSAFSDPSYRDTKWVMANETRHDFTYELGLEFVFFEILAAYISVRNFSYTGGGIGLAF